MGVATGLFGLLLTYSVLGLWSRVSLVALRFVQGAAIGGEWAGAVLLSMGALCRRLAGLYAGRHRGQRFRAPRHHRAVPFAGRHHGGFAVSLRRPGTDLALCDLRPGNRAPAAGELSRNDPTNPFLPAIR